MKRIEKGSAAVFFFLILIASGACVPEETSIDMERGPGEPALYEEEQDKEAEESGSMEEKREDQESEDASDDVEVIGEEPEEEILQDEIPDEEVDSVDGHSGESDLDGGGTEEQEAEEEVSFEEPEEVSFDLSCATEDGVCRFCGPPVDVVTSCPDGDQRFECQVFRLVNQERVSKGLVPVTYNAELAASAQMHAMDLSLCDYFAHNSLDGTTFFQRCGASEYDGICTGENIGGGQRTPQAVFDAWMASPSHRDNIHHAPHRELGVALYVGDGNFGRYWVKHFGR